MERSSDRYGRFASCVVCGNEIQLTETGERMIPIALSDEPRGYRVFAGTRWRRGDVDWDDAP